MPTWQRNWQRFPDDYWQFRVFCLASRWGMSGRLLSTRQENPGTRPGHLAVSSPPQACRRSCSVVSLFLQTGYSCLMCLIRNAQGASHWIPALHICRRDASRAKEEAYQFTRGGSPAECECDRSCPFPGASLFLLEMQIRKFVSHRRTRQEIQAPSARASDESPGFVCFSSPADARCRAFHLLEQYGSRLARGAKSRSHSLAYQPWLAPLIALERGSTLEKISCFPITSDNAHGCDSAKAHCTSPGPAGSNIVSGVPPDTGTRTNTTRRLLDSPRFAAVMSHRPSPLTLAAK